MATDANTVVQASTTKTATFNGAGLDLKNGTPRRGMFVRVIYTHAKTTSGTCSIQFDVDTSTDNNTFYTHTSGAEKLLSCTSTDQTGEIFLPVETTDRYIRVTVTITDTGSMSGQTTTYQADLVGGFPA